MLLACTKRYHSNHLPALGGVHFKPSTDKARCLAMIILGIYRNKLSTSPKKQHIFNILQGTTNINKPSKSPGIETTHLQNPIPSPPLKISHLGPPSIPCHDLTVQRIVMSGINYKSILKCYIYMIIHVIC